MGLLIEYLINNHILDLFTLWHLLTFVGVGMVYRGLAKADLYTTVLYALCLGVSWECLEIFLEMRWGWVEPDLNRWVTDILADLFGAIIGWTLVHIFATK
jgi:hypothetical protein